MEEPRAELEETSICIISNSGGGSQATVAVNSKALEYPENPVAKAENNQESPSSPEAIITSLS